MSKKLPVGFLKLGLVAEITFFVCIIGQTGIGQIGQGVNLIGSTGSWRTCI